MEYQVEDSTNKPFIFITGSPRSGTSMLTKVIDAHPDVAILMENIFGNRRRHWERAPYWNDMDMLKNEVNRTYSKLSNKVIGNKVCTPDVWALEDIALFCKLFTKFKIIFIVRDPAQVMRSRLIRENYDAEFSSLARKNLGLNFESRLLTYTSSWKKGIENYWTLKEMYPYNIMLVYYEDLCEKFERHVMELVEFLELPFNNMMLEWHKHPHHNSEGIMECNLKYDDNPVFVNQNDVSGIINDDFKEAVKTIQDMYDRWRNRDL